MEHPTTETYIQALQAVLPDTPDSHLRMLEAHISADKGVLTATQLAKAAGFENFNAANLQYGRFCHRLCDETGFAPPIGNSGEPTYTYVIAEAKKVGQSDWEWTLYPEFISAFHFVNDQLVILEEGKVVYPEEIANPARFIEGAKKTITVVAYERSTAARRKCLEYWGNDCTVCGLDFESIYGVNAARHIHVHHLVPLHEVAETYEVDPENDLRPVCPNCHTVLHSRQPPLSITELRVILRERKKANK